MRQDGWPPQQEAEYELAGDQRKGPLHLHKRKSRSAGSEILLTLPFSSLVSLRRLGWMKPYEWEQPPTTWCEMDVVHPQYLTQPLFGR